MEPALLNSLANGSVGTVANAKALMEGHHRFLAIHNTGTTNDAQVQHFVLSNYRDWETDRKSTRLNSSHSAKSRMPSSA